MGSVKTGCGPGPVGGDGRPVKPLPYYPQGDVAWWKRVFLVTVFRRWKCQTRWCSRPAVEAGSVCDLHGPWID